MMVLNQWRQNVWHVIVLVAVLWTAYGTAQTELATSVYTQLSEDACETVEVADKPPRATQRCPGIHGYQIRVFDEDGRMSITVIDPQGEPHPLNFWHVITPQFSHLGSVAEWRVGEKAGERVPHALIVRVYVDSAHDPSPSYLAVAKLTSSEICVTDRVPAGLDANLKARRAADEALEQECIE